MSAAVSNDSEIGIFAANTLTNFFRPLVESMPFIVDWLVTASEADRFHFRKIFQSMFRCYEMVGQKGHYSKYIRSGHRPAVCIWLKDCSEEQQVVFWEMMHALAASNTVTDVRIQHEHGVCACNLQLMSRNPQGELSFSAIYTVLMFEAISYAGMMCTLLKGLSVFFFTEFDESGFDDPA